MDWVELGGVRIGDFGQGFFGAGVHGDIVLDAAGATVVDPISGRNLFTRSGSVWTCVNPVFAASLVVQAGVTLRLNGQVGPWVAGEFNNEGIVEQLAIKGGNGANGSGATGGSGGTVTAPGATSFTGPPAAVAGVAGGNGTTTNGNAGTAGTSGTTVNNSIGASYSGALVASGAGGSSGANTGGAAGANGSHGTHNTLNSIYTGYWSLPDLFFHRAWSPQGNAFLQLQFGQVPGTPGGGGGGAGDGTNAGGGGGGSGAGGSNGQLMSVAAYILSGSGTFRCLGGDGGNGGNGADGTAGNAGGGGAGAGGPGGRGGRLVVVYHKSRFAGSMLVTGGLGGEHGVPGNGLGSGSNGVVIESPAPAGPDGRLFLVQV